MHISLTGILFIAIGSFVLGCGAWTILKLPHRLTIYIAAKELELRDRGYVGVFNNMTQFCSFCSTRGRIGINRKKRVVMYCWKCVKILVGPDEPAPSLQKGDSIGNVVYLHDHNKK